jgi:preprotein translocase subunit SecG
MKYFIYNCLFLVIILFFAYINTKSQQEAFTPKIRELYRPHVRNARIYSEGLYNNHSANISNLFRKFGIA